MYIGAMRGCDIPGIQTSHRLTPLPPSKEGWEALWGYFQTAMMRRCHPNRVTVTEELCPWDC